MEGESLIDNAGVTSGPPSSIMVGPSLSPSVWLSMESILAAIGTHRKQLMILVISAIVFGHFSVQTMAPTLTTEWLWETWPDLKTRVPYFNTVFAVSSICRLLGSILLLPMMDLWGRYPYILLFTILSFIFASISGASPNFASYAAFRSLAIFCASVLPSAATIYAVEMVQMKRRALPSMITQFTATSYVAYASCIKMALSNKSDSIAWRYAQTLFQLPTVIPIVLLLILQLETPRFLISNKNNKAAAFQTLIHLFPPGELELRRRLNLDQRFLNNHEPPLHEIVKLRGFEDSDSNVDEVVIASSEPLNMTPQQRSPRYMKTYIQSIIKPYRQSKQLFTDRNYRKATMALLMAWVFQSLAHWGMFTYMTVFFASLEVNSNLTTIGSFLFQIPIQVIVFWIMQQGTWGGRIPAIAYTALACSIASLILSIMMVSGVRNKGSLTTFCILSCILSGPIWGPLYSYSAERYPTVFRGAAMALFSSSNALSTVLTSFVGSLVISKGSTHLWLYPLVWGVLRLGVCASCFFMDREMNLVELEDKAGQSSNNPTPQQWRQA